LAIKKFTWNFQDYELYLFQYVLLTLLTDGIHFKFKRPGLCNHDIKVTKSHQNLLPIQTGIVCSHGIINIIIFNIIVNRKVCLTI
jgi:hypothetical protein